MSRCNSCGCNPCGGGCCKPARYSCDFSIQVDPYNPYVWLLDNCGKISRVNIPKIPETDTFLKVDFSSASLVYDAEYHQDVIPGCDLGSIINLDCLRDVEAPDPDSCDLLVFDPGCGECGDGCKPRPAAWRNYHIPDAEDCTVEPDADGYYHVLVKDDCGCIRECRIPMTGQTQIYYLRDSSAEDPDWPWIYGNYDERIDLDLTHNASRWFGKMDLEVTINYDVQSVRPTNGRNINFRSTVLPVTGVYDKDHTNPSMMACMLQSDNSTRDNNNALMIPWGTKTLRGSISFIVPRGQEAFLRHEFRLRNADTQSHYWKTNYDTQVVPKNIAGSVNLMATNASRLHSLQVVVRPVNGGTSYSPADYYQNLYATDEQAMINYLSTIISSIGSVDPAHGDRYLDSTVTDWYPKL